MWERPSTSCWWHNEEDANPVQRHRGKGDKTLPSVGTLSKEASPPSTWICLWTRRGEMGQQNALKRNHLKRQHSFFFLFFCNLFFFFFIFAWRFQVFISLHSFSPWYVTTQVWPNPESGFPGFRVCTGEVVCPENNPSGRKPFNIIINKHKIRSL